MKVIANRQLHGVYGTKFKDEEFDVADSLGAKLLARKLVRLPNTYAVKAMKPTSATVEMEHPEPRINNKRK